MPQKNLRVACIQIEAGRDLEKNWKQADFFLSQAAKRGAQIAALPENFLLRASEKETQNFTPAAYRKAVARLKKKAVETRMTIVAGSILEPVKPIKKNSPAKFFNTCFVISPRGRVLLRYRKMHLFEINLSRVKVSESRTLVAGKKPGMFKTLGITAGVGICYDLRFPEYFRVLSRQGAQVLFLPANFTAETGKTAWEVLLRARAIENQCFVVAPGQCGRHPGTGILSYGSSLIIDPQGKVKKRAKKALPQILLWDLELAKLARFRRLFPVLKHRKLSV